MFYDKTGLVPWQHDTPEVPRHQPCQRAQLDSEEPEQKGRDDPSAAARSVTGKATSHTVIDDDLEASSNPKVSPWVPTLSPAQTHRKLRAAISGRLKWLSQKLAHSHRQRKEDRLASESILGSNPSSLTY